MIDLKLDGSFRKLYQIVAVESGYPENPYKYRIQENTNFKYDECFKDGLVREFCWEFLDNEIFDSRFNAVKKAFKLYDRRIEEKRNEHEKEKNNIVKVVFSWDDLMQEVLIAVSACGKWPRPPK